MVIDITPSLPIQFSGLVIAVHLGLNSVETRTGEVITSGGYKIIHTGDIETSEALPLVDDVDVLLINAWVSESGTV